jgi:hypothetical protein
MEVRVVLARLSGWRARSAKLEGMTNPIAQQVSHGMSVTSENVGSQ